MPVTSQQPHRRSREQLEMEAAAFDTVMFVRNLRLIMDGIRIRFVIDLGFFWEASTDSLSGCFQTRCSFYEHCELHAYIYQIRRAAGSHIFRM